MEGLVRDYHTALIDYSKPGVSCLETTPTNQSMLGTETKQFSKRDRIGLRLFELRVLSKVR